ncbi:hypothetical protein PG994_009143 [Apiospora phragmitis]|uniref:Protein CASP n=1 Tax=Apiospora phragmitis TaxID=2905665 RepID=A0ABR1UIG2_9PEZI
MADVSEFTALEAAASIPPAETPAAASHPENTNKFQHAISAWRNVDLTSLVSTLDNTASDIVTYQRDSTIQRKDLAQKTKDFRKHDDAAKLTEIKGLLKAYQTFIDLLTNHSNLPTRPSYRFTRPYSMLVSEDTLPKLTEENQHLQKNITSLTSQLEETESRLQSESTTRKQLEGNLESKVKEVESSWAAVLEEKKDNWEAKEKALEEKVENQERLLTEIKASYEVNQRLKGSEDAESEGNRGHVTSAELEMVNSDLERTSARLAEVEARNEQLRLELAQSKSHVQTQAPAPEDDPAYIRSREEAYKRDIDTRLRSLEREAGLLKDERDALKAKVQKWSDYDDVKQELEVLKSIEFATGDDEDMIASAAGSNGAATKEKGTPWSSCYLQTRLESLQEEMSRTNADLERSQNLNAQLENDLANLQAEGQNAFPSGASVAGTYTRYAPSVAPPRTMRGGDGGFGGGEPYGGGSGMLPMITAQRDRFKKRITQLENELSDSHRAISQLRQETAALQKDNLQFLGSVQEGVRIQHIPFAAFRGRESARAYKRMSWPERVVYSVTRMVLASRTSRNLFAAYCVALHLLVFCSLYWLGTADTEQHASNLGSGVAAAMAAGGGGSADSGWEAVEVEPSMAIGKKKALMDTDTGATGMSGNTVYTLLEATECMYNKGCFEGS